MQCYLIASGEGYIHMEVRSACPADAEAIARLVNQAYRPLDGRCGWTHEADLLSGPRIGVSQVLETLAREHSTVLVHASGAGIHACVHVNKSGTDALIGMLAVDPAFQNGGMGKTMLSLAESHARMHFAAERFVLHVVSARTELLAFYLRRGYRRTDTTMDYPIAANAGTPKAAGLTIEILEKKS